MHVFGGFFLTSFGCRMEISAYVRRVLQVSMGAQQIGAYLASEKVETAARGHSVYCVNTALSAHAVENTSPCFLQVK